MNCGLIGIDAQFTAITIQSYAKKIAEATFDGGTGFTIGGGLKGGFRLPRRSLTLISQTAVTSHRSPSIRKASTSSGRCSGPSATSKLSTSRAIQAWTGPRWPQRSGKRRACRSGEKARSPKSKPRGWVSSLPAYKSMVHVQLEHCPCSPECVCMRRSWRESTQQPPKRSDSGRVAGRQTFGRAARYTPSYKFAAA